VKRVRSAAAAIVATMLAATGTIAATPAGQTPTNVSALTSLARDKSAVGGTNDNHGGAVSALARTIGDEATTSTTPTTTTTQGAQGSHGAAVSAVAKDVTLVGGPNNNHGGAVSAVARGTHGPSATHGQSATHGASLGHAQSGTHPTSH